MTNIKLFLIEPQTLIRYALAALLESRNNIRVVGHAADGSFQLPAQFEKELPNVVLIAAELTESSSVQIVKKIKELHPQMRFLALARSEDKTLFQRLMNAGCHGYLLKSTTPEELFQGVQAVANGNSFLGQHLIDDLLDLMVKRKQTAGISAMLSSREEEIARKIAIGYTSKQIAGLLGVSSKTIDTYRGRIMAKLGLSSRAELVRYGGTAGWLHQEATNTDE